MSNQSKQSVFVVTGITGQVGGTVARKLLAAGKPVRAVVRSTDKGAAWAKLGCEVAIAEMADTAALSTAFSDAEAVFVLLPPIFAPAPGFPEATGMIAALKDSLSAAKPQRVVALSTVGAQAKQVNLLTQLQLMEQSLGTLSVPIAFLRAAWFMENAAWDVESAEKEGVIHSFLQPLDQKFPMTATADIGNLAAELMQEKWTGRKVVELEGPKRISPEDVAAAFSRVLGRSVRAQAVPRDTWESTFAANSPGNMKPRIAMLDGFNQGWIRFESGPDQTRKGTTELETVLRDLIARQKK
jgi:uncharacterized protein YbjT (DUF2867 family)